MTRDEWISQFEDELKKLRPHVGERLATTLALRKAVVAVHGESLDGANRRRLNQSEPMRN